MAQTRPLTAEDLIGLPDDYELYEGMSREVAAAPDHSAIALNIAALVWNYVDEHQSGSAFGADASFRLYRNPDTLFLPDAAFVREERIPSDEDLDYPFEGAPDLAVEVRSLGDSAAELDQKMRTYIEAGTLLGWAIDPVLRTVAVYQPRQPIVVLRDGDTLDGGDVLPGLRIELRRVFRTRSRSR